jgi:hypothetical protein
MVHLLRLHFSVIRAIRWFIPIAQTSVRDVIFYLSGSKFGDGRDGRDGRHSGHVGHEQGI